MCRCRQDFMQKKTKRNVTQPGWRFFVNRGCAHSGVYSLSHIGHDQVDYLNFRIHPYMHARVQKRPWCSPLLYYMLFCLEYSGIYVTLSSADCRRHCRRCCRHHLRCYLHHCCCHELVAMCVVASFTAFFAPHAQLQSCVAGESQAWEFQGYGSVVHVVHVFLDGVVRVAL